MAKKKARKRGNGEGCIMQRKDGRWQGQVTIGRDSKTGKLKRQTFYGKTQKEVQIKVTKAQNDLNSGTFVEPSKVTVGEWLNTWLMEYKQASIRATTLTDYEYLIRVHLKPNIGDIMLKELKTDHVQRLYNKLHTSGRADGKSGGLSAHSIRKLHNVLHEAIQQACNNNLIIRNATENTTLPKYHKPDMRVLTVEEQRKLLMAVQEDRLCAAFMLDLATGLRLGELLGLRWQDVDLKEGIIAVKRSITRVKNFDDSIDTKTVLIVQEPKSKSGRRYIPIPENIIKALKQHRTRQKVERLAAGEGYSDNDLVFSTEIGAPIEPRNFLRKYYILVKKAGIPPVNFHSLRHSCATRLLEANEHPKIVQEILGHSNITLTLDTYSHVLPELKKAAIAKLNTLFDIEKESPSDEEGTQV